MDSLIRSLEAQQDVEQALDSYKAIRFSVARKFLERLAERYEALAQNLQHFSFCDKKKIVRSAAFLKYPYSIIVEIQDASV